MRSFEEVGRLVFADDKVNEAYRTYASLWLDFVDDNVSHFLTRGCDIAPIKNIIPSDYYDTYMGEAMDIAKIALQNGYFTRFADLYEEYPLLKEYARQLEAEFYDD